MSSGGAPGPLVELPDGFDFVQLLGSGGSGWVALARQTDLDRLVAVKRLFGAGRDIRLIATLRNEGRALANLRHPAVVQVFDLVVIGDDAALVMEYVAGGDLRGLLDTRSLSGAQRIGILLDVASALTHAHAAGIIHCDVKPANVLVGEDGRGRLADFGIARLGSSRDGVAGGTPRYMAPEQRGSVAPLTTAADTYAFALTIRETLPGSGVAVTGRRTDLLPRKLTRLLDSALDPDPGARPSLTQISRGLAAVPATSWDSLVQNSPVHDPHPMSAETMGTSATASVTGEVTEQQRARPSRPLAPRSTAVARRRRSLHRAIACALGAVAGVALTLLVLVAAHR